LWFKVSPRKIVHETPSPKQNGAKWTGGVAQGVEHLLCKFEAEFKPHSHQNNYSNKNIYVLHCQGNVEVLGCQALVAHTCNPNHSGTRDEEDHGLKLALSNSS
jgi:hypothetical protein